MSTSSTMCNITLDDSDLRQLEDLDPNQNQGFRTFCKLSLPILIIYTNELQEKVQDVQDLNVHILVRQLKATSMHAGGVLDALQIFFTSETDLQFNFFSNVSQTSFESIKNKNGLNINFNDFPHVLANLLTKGGQKQILSYLSNQSSLVLNISYEGTGKFQILQRTEYKNLELLELPFNRSSIQKAHQSIIFRFNYQKSKLAMLENSISSIYDILAKKNTPLLQFIQANVGHSQ